MPVGAMECQDKIYALDIVDNRAVVGTKDRRVLVWDVRNMKSPLQTRESPLKVVILLNLKNIEYFSFKQELFVVFHPEKLLFFRQLRVE